MQNQGLKSNTNSATKSIGYRQALDFLEAIKQGEEPEEKPMVRSSALDYNHVFLSNVFCTPFSLPTFLCTELQCNLRKVLDKAFLLILIKLESSCQIMAYLNTIS